MTSNLHPSDYYAAHFMNMPSLLPFSSLDMVSVPWAVQTGDLEVVKSHVNGSNVNEKYNNGRTALHLASDYGHANIVQFLVDSGADIEVADDFGIRPLLAAVWEGHAECVKILLSKGAKRNLIAPDGTPLIDCCEEQEIRDMLKD